MTTPSLNRLLISHITLRGPEICQLYHLIAAHPHITYDDLVASLVPMRQSASELSLDESPLRETLNFLLVAKLVEQQGSSRFKASFCATPLLADTPFPLLLLHHLHQHPDKRQRAPLLIYRQLVADDVVSTTIPALRAHMEQSPYHDLFAWTGEKVGFWAHLFQYLGLIRRLNPTADMVIVPQLSLLHIALGWVQQHANASSSLAHCLEVIETWFFPCITQHHRVHSGIAQTLHALHTCGYIHLNHYADAAQSLIVQERRVSDVVVKKDVLHHRHSESFCV